MKPVFVKNITLQFDATEEVDEKLVETMIELVNATLSDTNLFSQPQIVQQDDTTIQVIDLLDNED